MKKKLFDENVPGIVGTVRQNVDGHVIVDAEFCRDGQLNKTFLAGKQFIVHGKKNAVTCFVGDYVRIDKKGLHNLTNKYVISDLMSLLSKPERKQFAGAEMSFLFNGFVTGINIIGNTVSLRFNVCSRINSDGIKLNVNKVVSYSAFCDNNVLAGEVKGLISRLSCLIPQEQITLKLYRRHGEKMDMLSVVNGEVVENADNYVLKKC